MIFLYSYLELSFKLKEIKTVYKWPRPLSPPKLDIEAQTTSVHNVTQQSDFDLINDLLTFEPLGLDKSPLCNITHPGVWTCDH